MDNKDIIVAPISGTRLVNQLTALYKLTQHGYKPDLILAASGGAVTSSIAISAGWDPAQFKRSAQVLSSEAFVKSWVPEFMDMVPSWFVGIFQGSLYDHSKCYPKMFEQLMVKAMLKDIEMWILAYNVTEKMAALFCSTSEEKSILKRCHLNCSLTRSTEFEYLDGDVKKFGDAVVASSSVPAVVPAKEIDKKYYSDGGIMYASAFVPFRDQISNLDSFHIMYINGYDLDDDDVSSINPSNRSIVNTADRTTVALVRNIIIQDRFSCFSLLETKGKVENVDMTLQEYLEKKKEWRYSMCEMFPIRVEEINITCFNGEEILKRMMRQLDYIGLRVWYVN